MAAETKTRAQVYYEEVEALKAEGLSNAEAVRKVAERHGKKENAVRGSVHQYRTRHINGGGMPSRRRTARSVEDHVEAARQGLRQAMALIDREVEEARTEMEAAQNRYKQVAGTAEERKADLEAKLSALS